MMTTPTTEPSGGALATLVLLILVGIPTTYAIGFWWFVFGPGARQTDQKDENDVFTRRDDEEE